MQHRKKHCHRLCVKDARVRPLNARIAAIRITFLCENFRDKYAAATPASVFAPTASVYVSDVCDRSHPNSVSNGDTNTDQPYRIPARRSISKSIINIVRRNRNACFFLLCIPAYTSMYSSGFTLQYSQIFVNINRFIIYG